MASVLALIVLGLFVLAVLLMDYLKYFVIKDKRKKDKKCNSLAKKLNRLKEYKPKRKQKLSPKKDYMVKISKSSNELVQNKSENSETLSNLEQNQYLKQFKAQKLKISYLKSKESSIIDSLLD